MGYGGAERTGEFERYNKLFASLLDPASNGASARGSRFLRRELFPQLIELIEKFLEFLWAQTYPFPIAIRRVADPQECAVRQLNDGRILGLGLSLFLVIGLPSIRREAENKHEK
ncbi:MAG: hypothetical protein C0467_21110 [Planctomycetaceae bacterium]|nr:hypothetical protein [Planctomycetaceae bacterium]